VESGISKLSSTTIIRLTAAEILANDEAEAKPVGQGWIKIFFHFTYKNNGTIKCKELKNKGVYKDRKISQEKPGIIMMMTITMMMMMTITMMIISIAKITNLVQIPTINNSTTIPTQTLTIQTATINNRNTTTQTPTIQSPTINNSTTTPIPSFGPLTTPIPVLASSMSVKNNSTKANLLVLTPVSSKRTTEKLIILIPQTEVEKFLNSLANHH